MPDAQLRHLPIAVDCCAVFTCRDALPETLPDDVTSASDAFFCRTSFDPETLTPLEE
jgi:hypothetical protein